MNNAIDRVSAIVDAKLDLLIHIKKVNPKFYEEFVRYFLQDRLTFVGFEKDLTTALERVAGIMVYRHPDNSIWVKYKLKGGGSSYETFDAYEGAFRFAIGLLHIK